ncbi:MAG: efflux RND transporter periplasmic adaptor subunit [Gemmatimonadota bacterium]|nr:efflux RND transporter periplasmic adaptor subunit [Gemmatimonadota bacterium]
MKRRNTTARTLESAGLLLAAAGMWTACGDEPQVAESIRPVKYAEVRPASAVQSQRFAGTAKAGIEARLSFRTGGLVESIAVKVGDQVEAGQRIAMLDNRDAVLAHQRARAALENARVQKVNAQSRLIRVRQLYQADNVSLAEYEQAKNGFASATSSYESAEKSLDLQVRQLRYNEIYAPVAGIVTAVNNEVNEVIQAGAPLVELSAGEDIEMVVGVPEGYIARIQAGQPVRVRFSAMPGVDFAARVREIAYALGAASTYPVIVRLESPSSSIRPGMAGEVEFRFGAGEPSEDPLVVPIKAVGEDADGQFVFVIDRVVKGVGTVRRRPIRIGELLADGFVVEAGLADRELVATAGLRSLLNGMKVRLLRE